MLNNQLANSWEFTSQFLWATTSHFRLTTDFTLHIVSHLLPFAQAIPSVWNALSSTSFLLANSYSLLNSLDNIIDPFLLCEDAT